MLCITSIYRMDIHLQHTLYDALFCLFCLFDAVDVEIYKEHHRRIVAVARR